jgi:hypothetical protein
MDDDLRLPHEGIIEINSRTRRSRGDGERTRFKGMGHSGTEADDEKEETETPPCIVRHAKAHELRSPRIFYKGNTELHYSTFSSAGQYKATCCGIHRGQHVPYLTFHLALTGSAISYNVVSTTV